MLSGQSKGSGRESDLKAVLEKANQHNAENTRILSMLARDYLKERKSCRRWGWVFKGFLILYLLAILVLWRSGHQETESGPHTALVELNGLIAPSATSADEINDHLQRAFKAEESVGVVLRINSLGGTPVQASKINAEIRRLKEKYPEKPFYVVVSDACASGGYYVAVAADEIYGHPSSLIGSIGVRMGGFGFVDAMNKFGVERRLITAGENKGMLDPFSPMSVADRRHAESLINDVHQQFIDSVKQGRGNRLDENADLFSGLFWSGDKAKDLGLIDGFAGVDDIARDKLEAERVLVYGGEQGLLAELAKQFGVAIADQLLGIGLNLR